LIKLWNKSSNLSGSCSLFVALALPIFLAIFQGKQIQHFEKSFKRNFTISKRFFNNLVIRVYHVQISTIVKRKETTNFEAKENKFYKVFPDVIDVDVCGTKITGEILPQNSTALELGLVMYLIQFWIFLEPLKIKFSFKTTKACKCRTSLLAIQVRMILNKNKCMNVESLNEI